MRSTASNVAEYLAELPADRRGAVEAVRGVILKNLRAGFEEGMQYGMIGYFVPHSVYPAGYHCDPRQPLPFAGLASQKNAMSLYLMCYYMNSEIAEWFRAEWAKSGKKLDMGKACLRFKKVEDLALDVIGAFFKKISARSYVEMMTSVLAKRGKVSAAPAKKSATKSVKNSGKKSAAKKTKRV